MEIRSAGNGDTCKAIERASAFDRAVAAVCERLASRRIGFLWPGAPCDLDPVPGFTWVHYAPGANGTRRYDLNAIARPDLEARSLHMLVVPAGPVPLFAELVSGLLIAPSAVMIDGALRASVPVLFETSELLSWYASAADTPRKSLLASIEAMRLRGMEFLGFTKASAVSEPAPEGAVRIRESGWLAWSDIATRVCGAKAVQLSEGARLTPEARDRLMNLKIRIVGGDF